MASRYERMLSPIKINELELANRTLMSLYPTKYGREGKPTQRLTDFFVARAEGGVAAIVLDPPCPDYPRLYKGGPELRVDTGEHREALAAMVERVQRAGAKVFMQLSYPLDIPASAGEAGAVERKGRLVKSLLSCEREALVEVVSRLSETAKAAVEIGYDGVELQASYGGLLASFLSPVSNRRADEYGGSLENRSRLLQEVVKGIREAVGRVYPLTVKYTASEATEGGFGLEESVPVALALQEAGVDALLIDVGNKRNKARLVPTHDMSPGVNVPEARAIKQSVEIPVIAMGKINTPELAEKILLEGSADMVALTRALIADPDFVKKAAEGRPEDIRGCIYCLDDCADKGVAGLGRACTVNPYAGQESLLVIERSPTVKNVLVVGGGPAGMQAALVACQRGHRVTLMEREEELGGHFRLAHLAPFKDEVQEVNRYLIEQIRKAPINVELGIFVDSRDLANPTWDAVVLATGSVPKRLDVPGIDLPHVMEARDYLEIMPTPGKQVVVIGGGYVGCEIADLIADRSRVVVLEATDKVVATLNSLPKERLLGRLSKKGVVLVTQVQVVGIDERSVRAIHAGKEEVFPADQVVYSVGSRSEDYLVEAARFLSKQGQGRPEVFVVGDASAPGSVGAALRNAVSCLIEL